MIRRMLIATLSTVFIAGVAFGMPQAPAAPPAKPAKPEKQQKTKPPKPALANSNHKLDKIALKIDKDAQKFGDQAAFEALSERLNLPVADLQSQKQSSGLGFGQLFIANALAKASGRTFDQVVSEFKGGTGFGAIAKENNLKLGKIIKEAKRADKEIKKEFKEQQALLKHPEKAAKIESREQREAQKRAAAELRAEKHAAKPRGPKR